MLDVVQKRPSECSGAELAAFEGLVKKGDEVAAGRLRERIKGAAWLVFLFEKDRSLAGVAALKRPSDSYKRKVFLKAKSPEAAGDFIYEAGWIFVEDQFRGRRCSRLLLETVLALAGGQSVYATTKENNERMRQTNRHCGLKESGSPYPSDEGDYNLVLYTRQSPR